MAYVSVKMTERLVQNPLPRSLSQVPVISIAPWAEAVFGYQAQKMRGFLCKENMRPTSSCLKQRGTVNFLGVMFGHSSGWALAASESMGQSRPVVSIP